MGGSVKVLSKPRSRVYGSHPRPENNMEDIDIARACAAFADEKKAENIRILDLRNLSPVSDYFVLCTAMSAPQLRAVRDNIEDEMKAQHGERPMYLDGDFESQWLIIDYGNVMVHVLTPEKRDYYALEELWGDAPEISLTPELENASPSESARVPRKKPAAKKTVAKKAAARTSKKG